MISRLNTNLKKWKEEFQKKSIRTMIVGYFTLVSVAGMLLVTVLLYFNFIRTAESMIEQQNIQALDQTNHYLDSHLRNMMKISDTVYYQVIKNADLGKESIKDQLDLMYNAYREHVVSIAIFDSYGKVVEASPLSNLKERVDPRDNDWFINADDNIQEIHFSTPHVQNLFDDPDYRYRWVVSLSRNIEINEYGTMKDGILLVDINSSGIERVCQSAELGNSSYIYLMDDQGEIIYHPKQQLLYSHLDTENNLWAVQQEDGSYQESFDGEERLVTIKTVGYTGWKLVAISPLQEVVSQYSKIRVFVLLISLIAFFVMGLVNILVSSKIANPIRRLEQSVRKLERGELNTPIAVSGSYEIKHLGKTIQSMVLQMRSLMDDIVEEQEQKKKSELEALQTQINPHFLYNTLDSVIWMIENERYDGAVTMVTALARFFRISISKGKSIITVEEEMEHARNYLTIQNIRYKNKFKYTVTVEPKIKEMATVKLIVQPLIENAIYHGMAYMDEDEGGEIRVTAYGKNGELFIDVADNGSGMQPEVQDQVMSGVIKEKSKGSGIGVRNVQERIKLYFGMTYGIEIFSEPDEGTLVRIRMPQISIEEMREKEGE